MSSNHNFVLKRKHPLKSEFDGNDFKDAKDTHIKSFDLEGDLLQKTTNQKFKNKKSVDGYNLQGFLQQKAFKKW